MANYTDTTNDNGQLADSSSNRRRFMQYSAAASFASLGWHPRAAKAQSSAKTVQTVLGPVAPAKLGVALMHEHAPIVDWSELFESQPAPLGPARDRMLEYTVKALDAFHQALGPDQGPGAIVETTPIRIGRYPRLLVDLARRTKVHVIAATGFWCEALAPQHPWAVRLGIEKGGLKKMAELYVREITEGMEDPRGKWGEKFTEIKAGIIKIGTSTHLRPSERVCHIAAALASRETGCPITTHTTQGGGLEEAELLLKHGAAPERVIIGHQGFKDDRENEEAYDYHRLIAALGCYVQFDRVDHEEYPVASQARQIKRLIDGGFVKQVLVSHDHAPYYYPEFTAAEKTAAGWKEMEADYTVVVTKLAAELKRLGATEAQLRTILMENPQRVLAF